MIKAAIDALKKNLKMELEKIYFVTNSGYLGPGIVITLLGVALVVLTARDRTGGGLWLRVAHHLDGGLLLSGGHGL